MRDRFPCASNPALSLSFSLGGKERERERYASPRILSEAWVAVREQGNRFDTVSSGGASAACKRIYSGLLTFDRFFFLRIDSLYETRNRISRAFCISISFSSAHSSIRLVIVVKFF